MHPASAPRSDIDGLRFLGVAAMLGSVLAPRLLPGGHAGLDILFVVAGFLVTSTILSALDCGTFDFRAFYTRRISRLLPALPTMLAAVFIAGWFTLFAREYRELGRDLAGGVLLVNAPAPTRLLLHLRWVAPMLPLYVAWPLVLVVLRRRTSILEALVAALLVLSIAVGFFAGASLAIGCALALLQRRGLHWQGADSERAAILGVIVLAIGFALGQNQWHRMFPALGAALVLSAGPTAWLNRTLFGNWIATALGAIAHPLYLWFWPLFAFAYTEAAALPTPHGRLMVLAGALAAAIATHIFIERPLRQPAHARRKVLALTAATIAVGVLGLACYGMNGFPGTGFRDSQRASFVDYFDKEGAAETFGTGLDLTEKFRLECDFHNLDRYRRHQATSVPMPGIAPGCTERDPAQRHAVMLWGDSHAQHLYWGLKQTLPPDWQILQVASTGCFPDPNASGPSTTDYCQHSNWVALQTIAKAKPDVVIVAQQSGQRNRRFVEISAKIQPLGIKRTLFAGPTPHWMTGLPAIVARKLWPDPPRRTFVGYDPRTRELNDALNIGFLTTDAMAFVDIIGTFCNAEGCLTYLGDDVKTGLTSMDDAHLLPIASEYLARQLLARMVTGSVRD